MSAHRIDDAYLREPDAVAVGVLIHGERVCSSCGAALPASADYFTPLGGGGLTSNCRSCRRASSRASHRRRTEATP